MPAEFDDKLLIWTAGTLYMRTLAASARPNKNDSTPHATTTPNTLIFSSTAANILYNAWPSA